jgi:hypothetical protein
MADCTLPPSSPTVAVKVDDMLVQETKVAVTRASRTRLIAQQEAKPARQAVFVFECLAFIPIFYEPILLWRLNIENSITADSTRLNSSYYIDAIQGGIESLSPVFTCAVS